MSATIVTVEDLRRLARRRLPRMLFDYIEGGAETEASVRANLKAFADVMLRPQVLVDVSSRSLAANVAGSELALPILLSPVGLAGVAGPEAEVWAARAAASRGTVSVVSTASSVSLEKVSVSVDRPQWFQLYPWGDRPAVEAMIGRARRCGYDVMVVTVDVPVTGGRERDARNGMTIPPRPSPGNVIDLALHPRWLTRLALGPRINFANLIEPGSRKNGLVTLAQRHAALINPSHTWTDLRWMRDLWPGKVVAKGITNAPDALRAVEVGCDGVLVSNHGGRQLDHVPGTLQILPEVVAAVGDRVSVLLDGGIRRGTDIVKALALGADAVMVGRPWLYGAAALGQKGVQRAIDILADELDRTLTLMGKPAVADLSPADVRLRAGFSFTNGDALQP